MDLYYVYTVLRYGWYIQSTNLNFGFLWSEAAVPALVIEDPIWVLKRLLLS